MIVSLTINFPAFVIAFFKVVLNPWLTSFVIAFFIEVFATVTVALRPAFSPSFTPTLIPVFNTAKGALAVPNVTAVATSVTTPIAKLIALS